MCDSVQKYARRFAIVSSHREGAAMRDFIKHFRRDRDGVWTCVSPADLETVQGRVRVIPGTSFPPGTLFMGIDLVGMLDDEFSKVNGHRRWSRRSVASSSLDT